jgi:branched-chain amino acid transport system substrate-binding protein
VDAYTRHGEIRRDGRMAHDMYLMRIKTPAQSRDAATDIWERVAVIPAAEAFPPLSQSRCPAISPTQ